MSNPKPYAIPIRSPLHSAYTVSTILALVLVVHTIVHPVDLSISFFLHEVVGLSCVYSIGLSVACVYEPLETLRGQLLFYRRYRCLLRSL